MRLYFSMPVYRILLAPIVASLLAAMAQPATAAGRVQLELVGDGQGAALVFQQWMRVLSKAGVKNVRFRSSRATDKVGIQTHGTDDNPLYVVTGIVRGSDELLLPSGRFRRSDAGRLSQWLDELAELGPEEKRERKAAFGLRASQFVEIHEDLAKPIGFSTQGLSRREAVAKISAELTYTLRSDAAAGAALEREKIGEQLQGLSCGTVLAYVLRPAGYCLVPRLEGARPVYAVVKAQADMEIWPVGWEPTKPDRDILPALYEFHNVNVEGVSASKALQAIGQRLQVPVLIDHNALARHGVDPEQVVVSHPRRRTTYSLALRKILFQARLKSEVRIDEADQPFLWVTTVKPM